VLTDSRAGIFSRSSFTLRYSKNRPSEEATLKAKSSGVVKVSVTTFSRSRFRNSRRRVRPGSASTCFGDQGYSSSTIKQNVTVTPKVAGSSPLERNDNFVWRYLTNQNGTIRAALPRTAPTHRLAAFIEQLGCVP